MVFKGEKTLVFWVGLLVFCYSLSQFSSAIWQTIYFLVIYPSLYDLPSEIHIGWAQAYVFIPLIINGFIFAVIGLYMMKKGVKQEQPSTQN